MVPRFLSSSSSVMPMPSSETVIVRASLSKDRRIASAAWSTLMSGLVRLSKLSLSMASDAFEMSSLRKISLLV